jgi:hypothetical protein
MIAPHGLLYSHINSRGATLVTFGPLSIVAHNCVVIMMESGFRRNRQSGSSALECGRLKLGVIGLLGNGIHFMDLEPQI